MGIKNEVAESVASDGVADMFGHSVVTSNDGNTLIASTPDGEIIYIYTRNKDIWNQVAKVVVVDYDYSEKIVNAILNSLK